MSEEQQGRISHKYQKSFSSEIKIIVLIFLLSGGFPVFAQLTANFDSQEEFLNTSEEKYITIFQLTASSDAVAEISQKANTLAETLTFTIDKLPDSTFRCVILFTHPALPSYVKKTLIFLGITHLKIGESLYSIEDFDPES